MLDQEADDLMTVREAAEFLKVPRSWIYSRTTDGDFPVVKLGGHVRVPRHLLVQYVNARRVKPVA